MLIWTNYNVNKAQMEAARLVMSSKRTLWGVKTSLRSTVCLLGISALFFCRDDLGDLDFFCLFLFLFQSLTVVFLFFFPHPYVFFKAAFRTLTLLVFPPCFLFVSSHLTSIWPSFFHPFSVCPLFPVDLPFFRVRFRYMRDISPKKIRACIFCFNIR